MATNLTGMPTCSTTSVRICTVTCLGNCGGAGRSKVRSSDRKKISPTAAGSASAVSLSQYWKACTKVIERIPPSTTVATTTTAAPRRRPTAASR